MIFKKRLTRNELGELREINRVIRETIWKIGLVKENTVAVEDGQKWVKSQEGILKLLENAREAFIRQVCVRLKIEGKVKVDLETGKIWTEK